MDRRSFLATAATLALLPLTEAPALAAVAAKPGGDDAKLNALFEDIFQRAGARFARARVLARPRQGPERRSCKSKLDTRPAAGRAPGRPRAQPACDCR